MLILGIAGAKQAGKTTLANELMHHYKLVHLSFAAPMRQFVAKLLGVSGHELEKMKEQPIDWLDNVTPRHMLQSLGTEWGREMVHPDLWVRVLLHNIPPSGAIISDVRFVNEAELIRKKGGLILKVERPGTGHGDGHISEKPLPDELVNATILNNGDREHLCSKAVDTITRLRGHG